MKTEIGTFSHRLQQKHEMERYLAARHFDYFATAALNCNTSLPGGRAKLRSWAARMDHAILGPKWAKADVTKRAFFFAFPEHIASNLHYHLLISVPQQKIPGAFEAAAGMEWRSLVPSGTMKIEPITGLNGAARYVTKAMHCPDAIENFIISSEFVSSR